MIPQDVINLILDTARIEDVVSDFVTLKRRGANFVACCPFHNEKTPSFYVSPTKGIYKCFGCGKAGNAVGFVMEHEHLTYAEALRFLAKKYNIEIVEKEESAEEIASRQHSESLMLVTEFAQKFFVSSMDSPEGKALARTYFKSRGLEDETIARFGLGWAPSSRTALTDAARAAGFKEEYLLDAGLSVRYDDGRLADKFHERVTFPIHSVSGRVIAFSCRTLSSEKTVAKYMNSPETEIYVKSRSLYGIYMAKGEIARQDKCYLVEGNVDVVSMHQLGITNVVASCGTSLTVEQIRLIHRFTENVTIMYDGDSAGIHAAMKGIGMVLSEGMNVKVVLFPDGDDPDSFSRKHNLEEMNTFIKENEQDFIEFKSNLLFEEAKNDPLKKANLIIDISETIAQIPDAVKRSVYVETLAAKFKMDAGILFERIASKRRQILSDQRTEQDRQRRYAEAGLNPVRPQEYVPVQMPEQLTIASLETNKTVAPAERDILYFLLSHGCDTMEFESDSKFYSGTEEEKPTVADFIISSIDADGGEMLNAAYQKVYASYCRSYLDGLDQDAIIRTLLNSEDRETAFVVAQLSIEKYQITVKDLEKALTTTSSWLVKNVPHTLLFYMDKKLESKLQSLRAELAAAASDVESITGIMEQIVRTQNMQKSVKNRMKA